MPNINDNTIFISFFWTGSVPSVELKNNLGEWKKYLSYSNSNAEILLWTTHNDIEKIKQKNQGLTFFNDKNTISQLKEISPNIYNWSLPDANGKYHNIKVIEIENLISKYKLVYKGIIDIFNLLIKNNIYVFSSDLARILILDFLPGIYIDCDIENSSRRKFYSNIQEIKNKFQSSGFDIKFYYIMMVGNQGLLENQMIIAFEKNAFENVLQYYELQLNDNSDFFNDHIEDIESFKKNINHEKFMKLNKSFFNDKNDSKYLQFYNKEDYKNFRKLNENENISFSYPCLSFSYELLGIFFKYKNSMEYSMFYNSEMSNYFKIPNQDILLYSWKNPGFARLKKLQSAADIIFKKYKLKFVKKSTGYIAMDTTTKTSNLKNNMGSLNLFNNLFPMKHLIKSAQIEINNKKQLSENTFEKLINFSPKWRSLMSPKDDSKYRHWNFSMPKMLTISDIQALNRSAFYRFVISESGVIIFGYEDNIMTLSNGKRQNLTSDGIEIAPHSALNNYQPVISAGKIYYNHEIKKLTELSNYSGHFKPDSSSLVIAKIFFHHQFRELSDHIYLKPYSMKELQTRFPIKLN